jgi:hypothetical protein
LKRGPAGGGGNCLSFCARAGALRKTAAEKKNASAERTSAGEKYFLYLLKTINQLLMPPARIVAGKLII